MMNKVLLILAIVPCLVMCQIPALIHPQGKYIKANGSNLWVEQKGNGQPLILISGGPGGAHTGLHALDTLADHCRLIFYDAYGRGKSDHANDPKEYTLARDIEDLEQLRIALSIDKVSILGHSYGGVVAQGYALKYPTHVQRLVLVSTFHSAAMWQENDNNSNHEIQINYPEVWDTLMKIREQGYVSSDSIHQAIYERVPYGFLYAYNPDHFRRPLDISYPNPMNTTLYYQMVGRDGDFIVGSDIGSFDYRRQLPNLAMPILILAGRYDRVATPQQQMLYRSYCPSAKLVMYERSGHNPQVEEKGKVYDEIIGFMKQ